MLTCLIVRFSKALTLTLQKNAMHTFVFLLLANLTGHTEKVGMENFELLKVLGTGGESHESTGLKHLQLSLDSYSFSLLLKCLY